MRSRDASSRRASTARSEAHRLFVFLLFSLAGAGCGDDVIVLPFRDEHGRECVRTCDRDGCTRACDTESMPSGGCAEDQTPGFVVDFAASGGNGPASLCDACRSERVSFYWYEDCVPLVCEVDRDCAFSNLFCADGYCWDERFH